MKLADLLVASPPSAKLSLAALLAASTPAAPARRSRRRPADEDDDDLDHDEGEVYPQDALSQAQIQHMRADDRKTRKVRAAQTSGPTTKTQAQMRQDPFLVDWTRPPSSYGEGDIVARLDEMTAQVKKGKASSYRHDFVDPHGFRYWFRWTGPGGLAIAPEGKGYDGLQGARHGRADGDGRIAPTPRIRAALERYAKAQSDYRRGLAREIDVDVPAPTVPTRRGERLSVADQALARSASRVYNESGKPEPQVVYRAVVQVDGRHYVLGSTASPREEHELHEVVPRASWTGKVVDKKTAERMRDFGLHVGAGTYRGHLVSVDRKEWVLTGESLIVPTRTIAWDFFDGEVVHNPRTGEWLWALAHGAIPRNNRFGIFNRHDPSGLWVVDATAKDLAKAPARFHRDLDGFVRLGGPYGFFGLMTAEQKVEHARKWKIPDLVFARMKDRETREILLPKIQALGNQRARW